MEKRNTVQKQLVLQAVRELQCHPTADEVYQHVAARHPSISKATVYRNLNSLAEDGLLRRVAMPDAADRFDFTVGPHYHIKCACWRPGDRRPRCLYASARRRGGTGHRVSHLPARPGV